jgi:hypothetical protein
MRALISSEAHRAVTPEHEPTGPALRPSPRITTPQPVRERSGPKTGGGNLRRLPGGPTAPRRINLTPLEYLRTAKTTVPSLGWRVCRVGPHLVAVGAVDAALWPQHRPWQPFNYGPRSSAVDQPRSTRSSPTAVIPARPRDRRCARPARAVLVCSGVAPFQAKGPDLKNCGMAAG